MPYKRKPENRSLPSRWVYKNGAYYYLPPAHARSQWDGKSWFRLGSKLAEAYKTWAQRIAAPEHITTINAALDRYLLEVVPTKAAKTATENKRHITRLRPVFGEMLLADLEPQHIYQYVDRRQAKTAAKREVEVLSHVMSKAVKWGLIKANPLTGQVRIEKAAPRERYVEDWELVELMSLPPRKRKGSVGMIQAYLRIKMLTGMRQRDLLLLTMADIKDDGIHVTPSKTRKRTGKRIIYAWTPELRAAIDAALSVRPALSPYLFCNRYGAGFVEDDGTAGDWNNLWQRFMKRLLAETSIKERFTEHDLRAKVASDAESLERARQLLAHADPRTTDRVYRRKAEIVMPAGRKSV